MNVVVFSCIVIKNIVILCNDKEKDHKIHLSLNVCFWENRYNEFNDCDEQI